MSFKKFENNDVFYNTIKTKPRFEFKIWGGNVYVNNDASNAFLNDLLHEEKCGLVNILDFSCPETSYNYSLI